MDATVRTMDGGEMSFGHNYPDGGALVFSRSPFITPDQWLNRQIFQVAASLSGTTLYPGEDWHVSYGDNLASLDNNGNIMTEYVAKYGPLKGFDMKTGEVRDTDLYSSDEIDKTFEY